MIPAKSTSRIEGNYLIITTRILLPKKTLIKAKNQDTSLTPRQKQVMELMQARKVHKEIAVALGIEVRTVKYHAARIYSKLKIASREDLFTL